MAENDEVVINERAAELAQNSPQQLLGYIAALLEVSVKNQVALGSVLQNGTFEVKGSVWVNNLPDRR